MVFMVSSCTDCSARGAAGSALHLAWQPEHDVGHEIRQDDRNDHQCEQRQRSAGDPGNFAARHALQHKEVEAHRRRDLRHLHTNTMKMPNHTRSKPAASTVGSSTAMVSTTMEMPSRKQPSRMKNM